MLENSISRPRIVGRRYRRELRELHDGAKGEGGRMMRAYHRGGRIGWVEVGPRG